MTCKHCGGPLFRYTGQPGEYEDGWEDDTGDALCGDSPTGFHVPDPCPRCGGDHDRIDRREPCPA